MPLFTALRDDHSSRKARANRRTLKWPGNPGQDRSRTLRVRATLRVESLEARQLLSALVTTDFTDATTTVNSVSMGAQSGTATYGTSSGALTYTVTIDASSSGTGATLGFTISGLPAGVGSSFSPSTITVAANASHAFSTTTLSLNTSASTFAATTTFSVSTTNATANNSGTGTVAINERAITVTAVPYNKTGSSDFAVRKNQWTNV